MTRPYFILVSIDYTDETPTWAIEFGAYDRDCVRDELDDMRNHPAHEPSQRFKIIRTASDDQATINAAVAALNPAPTCCGCDRPPVGTGRQGLPVCAACGEEGY